MLSDINNPPNLTASIGCKLLREANQVTNTKPNYFHFPTKPMDQNYQNSKEPPVKNSPQGFQTSLETSIKAKLVGTLMCSSPTLYSYTTSFTIFQQNTFLCQMPQRPKQVSWVLDHTWTILSLSPVHITLKYPFFITSPSPLLLVFVV